MVPEFLIARFGAKIAGRIFYGGIAAIAVIALIVGFAIHERGIGASKEIGKQQDRTIKVQEQAGKANENAADRRVEDAKRGEVQKGELDDTISNGQSADDRRRARGCVVLRQQGRSADAAAAGC